MSTPLPSILLLGPTGTGKTTSIRTLVAAGLETFVLFTEPSMEVLADLPPDRLHWHYQPPTTGGWNEVLNRAHSQIDLDFKSIQRDAADPNKGAYSRTWYNLLHAMFDFPCDRTGQSYGDVTTWGADRALVIDGLSGVNEMAIQNMCGAATTRDKGQYGAAMDTELSIFGRKLVYDTQCCYVLISHTKRAFDSGVGQDKWYPAALGSANLSQWPIAFTDVVHAKRAVRQDGSVGYFWDTAGQDIDVKPRNLPAEPWLEPDFGPLLRNWQGRMSGGTAV